MLKPLLVLGAGRNGSTALMSLLGGSPLIAFDKSYPYETTYLSYFAHMAKVPHGSRKQAREIAQWVRDDIVHGKRPILGPIPFKTNDYLEKKTFEEEMFRALWTGFSEAIYRKSEAEGGPRPVYYAEKAAGFAADACAGMEGLKQIHLLRDPRDILLSSKSFNQKRGTLRFGWRADDSDLSYAQRMMPRFRKRMEAIAPLLQSNGDVMILKYETLVGAPEKAAADISALLGIEISVADQIPAVEAHKTSKSPAASLGRWKQELDDETQALFRSEMAETLEQFGYEN